MLGLDIGLSQSTIHLGHLQIRVSEHGLDAEHICTVAQYLNGKGATQGMGRARDIDAASPFQPLHNLLQPRKTQRLAGFCTPEQQCVFWQILTS
jgi:hypothetical protein